MTEQTGRQLLQRMFRIGKAERQLENLDVPGDVLDRIADDIGAVTDDECPPVADGPSKGVRDGREF